MSPVMSFPGAEPQIARKLARLAEGATPRVLDLFAGCGGLSLGFQRAGFKITASVEIDPDASASHGSNFHPGDDRYSKARNILQLSPERLTASLGLGPPGLAFDVMVGGPPCQAFARVGRSKLREIADHPEAFTRDPRSQLYLEYLKYVRTLKPLALLIENVPDVLNHGGQNIAEEICEVLEQYGYVARYTLLNSAYYGVPQMRERMMLVAYRAELVQAVSFPTPTHWIELPVGYRNSRHVALKHVHDPQLFGAPSRYTEPPEPPADVRGAVTARAALEDLPPMVGHLRGESRRGVRRLDEFVPYPETVAVSEFATEMRNWPGFSTLGGTTAHVTRHLPRDWRIFERMAPGDQYPEALEHSKKLFDEHWATLDAAGAAPKPGEKEFAALRAQFVPPYDAGKFPNKWRKMEADQPARTLMAHLGKDTYSHIHHDSQQARTISVREAARLQSFPDGFVFRGAMNSAFRQIGNAVPPLLAAAVAATMRKTLDRAVASFADDPLRRAAG